MACLLVLLAVALAASAIGWKYIIYFFSIGYGFSIAALAVAMLVIFRHTLDVTAVCLCAVLFLYGCRLGGYLLWRERKSAGYRKILYEPGTAEKKSFFESFFVWIFCAILYVTEVSPVFFRLLNKSEGVSVCRLWAWVGFALMVSGALLEAVADAEKQAAKKKNPGRFVDTGVYRLVRCPNYFGEVVLWTGCLVSGFGAGLTLWQWIIAAVGYIGILYVMFSGARRLELRQNRQYGDDPEYRKYAGGTPVLIPFIPLYSVVKYTFLKA